MIIHIRLIPLDIIKHYNLNDLVDQDEWIYMKIIRGMYGLPQAGILENNLPAQHLINHGCYQFKQKAGLWIHVWRHISFTLVEGKHSIGYFGREHADHMMSILKIYYKNHNRLVR